MIRMLLLLFCVCSSVLLAVDSATGSFSVQLTRRNAQAAVGAPFMLTVSVTANETSSGWQIAGRVISDARNCLVVRPAVLPSSATVGAARLVGAGRWTITDVPAWVDQGSKMLRRELDLQGIFIDVLMGREDFCPVLTPGDYDLEYVARTRIRRSPTAAEPTPDEREITLNSNRLSITILPPTASDLAWSLARVEDPAATPEDLHRALVIARSGPVEHRRAVLESQLSQPWYRAMALLRLAGGRPDPSFTPAIMPWIENEDDDVAACAAGGLMECDPAKAVVMAREFGPQMRPGNFRCLVQIMAKYGKATDIPFFEAMKTRVPQASAEENADVDTDLQQFDRTLISEAIAAIRSLAPTATGAVHAGR